MEKNLIRSCAHAMPVEIIWLINSFVLAKYIQQKKFKSYQQQLINIKLIKKDFPQEKNLKIQLLTSVPGIKLKL